MNKKLLEHLLGYLTPQRIKLFEKNLDMRTKFLTVVLENIYQAQNASAVLRTCDCFGIQDVHIIENYNSFQINKEVAMGASKWLSLHKYNEKKDNSVEAIRSLKSKGYRIVATTPHTNDTELENFDISKQKTALVFGSEKPGLTDKIMQEADEFLKIPMYGFTESFNISVSAAIILHHLTLKMKNTDGLKWQLSQAEKDEIKYEWARNSIKRCDLIEKHFLEKKTSK